ncbi:MAG TPA: RHS repeat-associated core domain-containing protein, partial [Bacteroidales bacterium]|nr:RHS repeat-associated core domain-containing protein [Bacteroidales bacterium]
MNAKRKPYSFIFLVFIDTNRDAGADGKSKLYYGTNGTPRYNNPNKFFALDAFSYSLEYYSNDYNPIKESIPVSNLLTTIPAGSGYKTAVKDSGLYNGNITRTVVSMRQSGNTSPLITVAGYAYQYDRLNRIKLMQTCLDNTAKDVQTNNTWQGISVTTKYKNSYSYDGNGNITKLRRYDDSGNLMDRLSYNYFSNNNKLKFVHDSAGTTSYAGDLEDQSHSNYNYNQIGSLIKDSLSDANSITWASYGLGSIYKRNGKRYSMLYDALARRTVKYNQTAQISTYNTFDASGNIMGIYEMKVGSNGYLNLYIKELPIYGSSRLGVLKPDRALTYINGTPREYQQPNPHIFASTYCSRRYELTNHLGNVMVTIKDKRIAVDANSNGITDYYLPDVESTIDYYPFGQEMPGRVYSPTSYRYGFNGKENDNEVAGTGNWQNYGMREYDARVCRFISVDPLTAKFPWYTPYQFAGNKPMIAVDLDGLEERIVIRTNTK